MVQQRNTSNGQYYAWGVCHTVNFEICGEVVRSQKGMKQFLPRVIQERISWKSISLKAYKHFTAKYLQSLPFSVVMPVEHHWEDSSSLVRATL